MANERAKDSMWSTAQCPKGTLQSGVCMDSAGTSAQLGGNAAGVECDKQQIECTHACDPKTATPNSDPKVVEREKIDMEQTLSECKKRTTANSAAAKGAASSAETMAMMAGISGFQSMAAKADSNDNTTTTGTPKLPGSDLPPWPPQHPSTTPNNLGGGNGSGDLITKPIDDPKTAIKLLGKADCSLMNSAALEECSNRNVADCMGKFKVGKCENFSARYCSSKADNGQSSQAALKAGEGVGSDYCNAYTKNDFCASVGSDDPTVCPPAAGGTATALAVAKKPSAGGGGFAGGSSGGMGGSGSAAAGAVDTDTKAPAGKGVSDAIGTKLAGAQDAGGGGGYSPSSISPFSLDGDSATDRAKKNQRTLASNESGRVASASDVGHEIGLSVFAISSEVMRGRCKSGRLLHCGPGGR